MLILIGLVVFISGCTGTSQNTANLSNCGTADIDSLGEQKFASGYSHLKLGPGLTMPPEAINVTKNPDGSSEGYVPVKSITADYESSSALVCFGNNFKSCKPSNLTLKRDFFGTYVIDMEIKGAGGSGCLINTLFREAPLTLNGINVTGRYVECSLTEEKAKEEACAHEDCPASIGPGRISNGLYWYFESADYNNLPQECVSNIL